MADLNYVLISGVVPRFNNAFRIFNRENEEHAVAHLSLSNQTSRRDENNYHIDEIFDVTVFGKTALTLEKFANPGQGLWFVGRLTPTRKRKDRDGADVLDANGRPIYTGMGFTAFTFGATRDYTEKRNNNNSQPSAQNTSQAYNPFGSDFSAPQQAPAAQKPAAKPSAGGTEDNWPFNNMDLPF